MIGLKEGIQRLHYCFCVVVEVEELLNLKVVSFCDYFIAFPV